jgi:hypothetical protein
MSTKFKLKYKRPGQVPAGPRYVADSQDLLEIFDTVMNLLIQDDDPKLASVYKNLPLLQ